jgi:hypothetical protein
VAHSNYVLRKASKSTTLITLYLTGVNRSIFRFRFRVREWLVRLRVGLALGLWLGKGVRVNVLWLGLGSAVRGVRS